MNCPSYDLFFETISNRTRIKILNLLRKNSLSATQICISLDEEQSKISHNLKKLNSCKIIECTKQGKEHIYSLNKETIIPIFDLVEKHVNKYCGKECQRLIKK